MRRIAAFRFTFVIATANMAGLVEYDTITITARSASEALRLAEARAEADAGYVVSDDVTDAWEELGYL